MLLTSGIQGVELTVEENTDGSPMDNAAIPLFSFVWPLSLFRSSVTFPCHTHSTETNATSDGGHPTMPVAKMLGKNEVVQAWTSSPYTKSFRHLLPYNRHWERRMVFRDPIVKSAKRKDRIKYWNIVPGDQVRIRGEEGKSIYEVMGINRLSNQVRLKVPASVSARHGFWILLGADANVHHQG